MSWRFLLPVFVAGSAAILLAQEFAATFRAEARVVEVYATVIDHRGRFVDGLPKEVFHISDNGQAQPISSFESNSAQLSCAILLDTTGSMKESLPAVKNAIGRLIEELREEDSAAIYGFSNTVETLQDFTSDKAAAKRAVMRTRALGVTALFDALTRVMLDIGSRSGKKVVVAYTDGDDNASMLNAEQMMERSKKSGIPIYTVAQGEARSSGALMARLKEIARFTGGRSYSAKNAHEGAQILQDISSELQHTYLLSYKAPEARAGEWRQVRVSVAGIQDYTVRSKEGYYPQ